MKYVILNVDCECGGEAYLQTVNSEAELKETLSSYNTAVSEDTGIKFYNDGEDDFTTSILLNEKGLKEFRDALNGANPFDKNKYDYKSWLSDGGDSDDE